MESKSRSTHSIGKGQWRCYRRLVLLILVLATGLLLYSASGILNLKRMDLLDVKRNIALASLRQSLLSKRIPEIKTDHEVQSAYRDLSVGSAGRNTLTQNSGSPILNAVNLQKPEFSGKSKSIAEGKSKKKDSEVPLNDQSSQASGTNVKNKQSDTVQHFAAKNVPKNKIPDGSQGEKAHDSGITNIQNTSLLKANVSSEFGKAVTEFKIPKRSNPNKVPRNYLTIGFQGRLGNRMFEYASMLGIATQNNLKPVIDRSDQLTKIFKVDTDSSSAFWSLKFTKKYVEKKGCTYESGVWNIGDSENVRLIGFYQSWKYFSDPDVKAKLRQQFQFKEEIKTKAKQNFDQMTSSKSSIFSGKVTYIAVHIRRGDMTYNKQYVKYGYTSPEVGYIKRGMEKFRSLYRNCVFVIASDDLDWCKTNILDSDVVFVTPGNSPEMDMAILIHCDHTLMTVGSYGWWIAWLNNGTTIYYSGYPTPGSNLAAVFNSDDYRPPNWIAMT